MDKDQIIQKVLSEMEDEFDTMTKYKNSMSNDNRSSHASYLSSLAQVYAVLNGQPVSFTK